MESVEAIRKAQRADGTATILAIGTAHPPNAIEQSTFALLACSFSKTNYAVQNLTSMIKKRYFYHNEEFLVMCTSCGVDMPSADYRLAKLLDLRPNVNKYMVYMQGCYAGGTVLRYAKDLAENNRGARVLVVCAELTIIGIRGPNATHIDNGIGNSLFGDGAAALVVGADPIVGVEKLFILLKTVPT